MKVWIVREGELRAYERIGECNGCGQCCREINYRYETATGPKRKALEASPEILDKYEGWAAEEWSQDGLTWRWWGPLTVCGRDRPCAMYDDKERKCKLFGKPQRLAICTAFPLRPEDMKGLDECPYLWREIDQR